MKLQNKPFTIIFLEWMVLPLSIFFHPKYQKYEGTYIILFFLIVTGPTSIGELYMFSRLTSFIEKADVALLTTSTISIFCIILAVHSKRKSFVEVHNAIMRSEFVDQEFFDLSDAFLKRILLLVGTVVIFCLTLLIIFPVLIANYADEGELGSLPTLLYPAMYPWSINTIKSYILTLLFQCVSALLPLLVIGGIILFTSYSRVVVHCFFLILLSKIAKIDETDECEMTTSRTKTEIWKYKFTNVNSKKSNRNSLRKLRYVIKYYQFFNM